MCAPLTVLSLSFRCPTFYSLHCHFSSHIPPVPRHPSSSQGAKSAKHTSAWIGSNEAGQFRPSSSSANLFEREKTLKTLPIERIRPASASGVLSRTPTLTVPTPAPAGWRIDRDTPMGGGSVAHHEYQPKLLMVLRGLSRPLQFTPVQLHADTYLSVGTQSSFDAWLLPSRVFSGGNNRVSGMLAIVAHPFAGKGAHAISMRQVLALQRGANAPSNKSQDNRVLAHARVCGLPLHRHLHESGYNTLVFEPHEMGCVGSAADEGDAAAKLLAVLSYVAKHKVLKYCKIVLLTQGIGASAAIIAMGRAPLLFSERVKAMSVCQPAPMDHEDLVNDHGERLFAASSSLHPPHCTLLYSACPPCALLSSACPPCASAALPALSPTALPRLFPSQYLCA